MDRAGDQSEHSAPRAIPSAALRLMRVPGEFGVIVRCSGELSAATSEALQRELIFLEPLDHPLLTLNLAGCHFVDLEGVRTILQSAKRLRVRGRRLVVVTGGGAIARELQMLHLDWIVPVYPTEEAAALVLRGWSPPLPGPGTWEAARAESLIHWQLIQEAVHELPQEMLLRLLTSMTPLCEYAEQHFQEDGASSSDRPVDTCTNRTRCQFCPLFYASGGRRQDVGCQNLLDPILAAVRSGDRAGAAARVGGLIERLKRLLLPEAGAAEEHDVGGPFVDPDRLPGERGVRGEFDEDLICDRRIGGCGDRGRAARGAAPAAGHRVDGAERRPRVGVDGCPATGDGGHGLPVVGAGGGTRAGRGTPDR